MDLLLLSDNLFFRDGVHRLCPGGVSLLCKAIWALCDHSTPEIFGVADSVVCDSACIYLIQAEGMSSELRGNEFATPPRFFVPGSCCFKFRFP